MSLVQEKYESSEQVTQAARKKNGRLFTGHVLSGKMKDTSVVSVTRYVKHAKYGKYMRRRKKYLVHDPGNQFKTGEKVRIQECRPISKRKNFIIVGYASPTRNAQAQTPAETLSLE